jgi:hypothetical protein
MDNGGLKEVKEERKEEERSFPTWVFLTPLVAHWTPQIGPAYPDNEETGGSAAEASETGKARKQEQYHENKEVGTATEFWCNRLDLIGPSIASNRVEM